MLPLDVYLENEHELTMRTTTGEVVDELKGTFGEKLLRKNADSRLVVNFHGVSYLFPVPGPVQGSLSVLLFMSVTFNFFGRIFVFPYSSYSQSLSFLLWY